MLSVCASIHNSPKSCEAFIRSIYDNATGEDFEVILVSDRNPPEEDAILARLATSYPRLSLIPVGKSEQLSRQWNLGSFRRYVYDNEIADYVVVQLIRFERDGIDLWLQYAYGLNLAASKAKGDFLLFTPADFVVMCDVHKMAKVIEGHATTHGDRFFGHFSLVAPFYRCPCGHQPIYEDAIRLLNEKYVAPGTFPVTEPIDWYWPFNHGISVVDRKTFVEVDGFRDEFLSKPGPFDIFNRMARAVAYGPDHARLRKSVEDLTGFRARMAVVPFDDDPPIEYLYANPCDADVVRKMQNAEEKCVMTEHPELKGLWE